MKKYFTHLVNCGVIISLALLILAVFPIAGTGKGLVGLEKTKTAEFTVIPLASIDRSASTKDAYAYADRDTVNRPSVKNIERGDLPFIQMGKGMAMSAYKLLHNEPLKVAFLGGSITHMKGWRNLLMDYLTHSFPGTDFTFLDAGIPSLGSVPHAFRLQNDVLNKIRPDLLFVEAAVNDEGNGTTKTEQLRALEGIVRHALSANSQMDIVLMAFADEVKNNFYAHGQVPVTVQMHEKVASYYQLPFINLAKEVYMGIHQGAFSWEKDFKSLHPAPFGQAMYFHAIRDLIEQALRLSNDAMTKKANKNLDISVPVKLPKPMQKYSYVYGMYVDVKFANHLNGFHYIDNWQPNDGARVRPGFVHVPVLVANRPGDELNLDFEGTAVGIAVASGPDAGAITYQIDGHPWQYMDLHTKWSANLHLPWYVILGDGLKDKKHRLVIKMTNRRPFSEDKLANSHFVDRGAANKSAQQNQMGTVAAVRIVHFFVNDPHKK